MARADSRTPEQVQSEIASEREQLAEAVDTLRDRIRGALDIAGTLRARLPAATAAALGAGFFLAGGIGATMRLLARRGREGETVVERGRLRVVDRR